MIKFNINLDINKLYEISIKNYYFYKFGLIFIFIPNIIYFSNKELANYIGLNKQRVILISIFIISIFFINWIWKFFLWLNDKWKNIKIKKSKIRYLKTLSYNEKYILNEFISNKKNIITFNTFKPDIDGTVTHLTNKNIISEVSNLGLIMEGFPYKIDEDVESYLNKNPELLGNN